MDIVGAGGARGESKGEKGGGWANGGERRERSAPFKKGMVIQGRKDNSA